MATSSLTKMSVPLPDQDAQGLMHPKLKYRFRIIFTNFGFENTETNELTKQIISAARPSLQHEPIVLDVYNSKIFLAGKHTWQPITVEVRDDASGLVQRSVGQQLQKQLDHMEQASPVAGEDYKFRMKLEILDGGNGRHQYNSLETWDIMGCFIQDSNFNDLNYAESQPATISMTIQYDNAVHIDDTGVGAYGNRTQGELATNISAGGGLGGGDAAEGGLAYANTLAG